MTEEGKSRTVSVTDDQQSSAPPQPPPSYHYGTFQGVASYHQQDAPPPSNLQCVIGIPQPILPPASHSNCQYYFHGYQTASGYEVVLVRPVIERTAPVRPVTVRPAPVRPVPVRPAPVRPVIERTAPVRPVTVRTAPVRPVTVRTAPVRPVIECTQERRVFDLTCVRHVLEYTDPCFGHGIGWILFITGFFFGAIPWYIGAFILLCLRVDQRAKPALVACTIAACLALIALALGVKKKHHW